MAVYQSDLFADVLPVATRRFEADGVGRLIGRRRPRATNRNPVHGMTVLPSCVARCSVNTEPVAACFVGGMEGIQSEYFLFTELYPERPTYPVGRPGGQARALVGRRDSTLTDQLASNGTYPHLAGCGPRLGVESLEFGRTTCGNAPSWSGQSTTRRESNDLHARNL